MNTEALFLFLILLLGLLLCSFLGGNCSKEGFDNNRNKQKLERPIYNKNMNEYDNYNHYNEKDRVIEKYTNYGADRREDVVDNREDVVDNREDIYGNHYGYDNRADRREDVYDRREDVYDNREDVVDNHYGYGNRVDRREDVYDRREDVVDNRYHGPNDALPPGIPRSQIPPGQEDLYILKSEVVPPVCPVCPASSTYPRKETCPPCPACARCPEPAFECKKVPNYNAIGNDYLPAPVLADFSTFGM